MNRDDLTSTHIAEIHVKLTGPPGIDSTPHAPCPHCGAGYPPLPKPQHVPLEDMPAPLPAPLPGPGMSRLRDLVLCEVKYRLLMLIIAIATLAMTCVQAY